MILYPVTLTRMGEYCTNNNDNKTKMNSINFLYCIYFLKIIRYDWYFLGTHKLSNKVLFNKMWESIHYNLVEKNNMICYGVDVLHPANLRKSSERAMNNCWLHNINLLLCATRSEDSLKFSGCKTWIPICYIIFRTKL